MADRAWKQALAAFVICAATARTAFANPLPPPPVPEGQMLAQLLTLLVIGCIAIEWIIVRTALPRTPRHELRLLAFVIVANALSYPATLWAVRRIDAYAGEDFRWVAEAVPVTIEFVLYVVAFVATTSWSPFRARQSTLRIFVATVVANAVTWLIGLGFDAFWFRR